MEMAQVDDDYEANKRVAESLKEYMGKRLNVMNAFDTPILEGLMAAVKVEPLQRIGTVLDASAKCYAFRVDNTYSTCYKVLSVASGGLRVNAPIDQNEDETVNSNEEEGDKNGTNTASENDGEGSGDGDKKGKNKSSDSSCKAKQLTRENRQLAEGLWKRFTASEHFGDSEDDLGALFEQLSNDISGTVMKRRVGAVHGSLERKDNQFSIEDAIYRKITRDFEEGSARSFVSNEVLTNDHGNFLVLHTNWEGDEPFRPFPSLVNHLSTAAAQCQTKAMDQLVCAVKRAQSKRPSEDTLLTQICADDGQSLPTIDFQAEHYEQQNESAAADGFDGGGAEENGTTVVEECDDFTLCQMDVDEPFTNPPFADSACSLLTDGPAFAHENIENAIEIEETLTNATNRGEEAFGTEMAEREKQLAGGDEDIGDEQIGRLIDENLLPPTQTDNENFVPLKNTLIEDSSHWMGDKNLEGLTPIDQTKLKKRKTKRPIYEAGVSKVAKRRLLKEELNGIADDMCWIPKRVVSAFVKSAIADIQQSSLARRILQMDNDFSDGAPLPSLNGKHTRNRSKQLETNAYDPINMLKARFFESHLGVWSFFPYEDGPLTMKRVRLIRRSHFLPPFSTPLLLNEQQKEFTDLYLELINELNTSDDATGEEIYMGNEEQMEDGEGTFGDEVPIDDEFVGSTHSLSTTPNGSPKRKESGSEGTDDETGFGFLNSITLSEIKQIYFQTNFNVANVKKAILKVISSQKKHVSADCEVSDADEDDSEMSFSSSEVDNEPELSDAEDAAEISDDATLTAAAIQNTVHGISSRELFAKLPRFLNGITKRNLTVTNSFAVLLHLCNDKQFILAQMKGANKLVEAPHKPIST